MKDLDRPSFLRLLRDSLGLQVGEHDLDTPLEELSDWDSVMLLKLLSAVEDQRSSPVPMLELLEAHTLAEVHLAVAS